MTVNVAYACDDAYIEQTSVSLISLFENNKDVDEIVIYFINMGINDESKAYLNELVHSYNRIIHIIDFDEIAFDLNVNSTGRHTKSVYAKFFFGRINDIDRIIYLDSDIVVNDSIVPLWTTELDGCICAGVETLHSADDNIAMGLNEDTKAINDGMVLMDLQAWRNNNCLENCLRFINDFDGEPPVLSEGTINNVLLGRIKIIHPRYNLMSGIVNAKQRKIEVLTGRDYYSQKQLDEASNNPCVIHYLSGFYNRPWCSNCSHPLKNIYLMYREKTKWSDTPLVEKKLPVRLKMIGYAYRYLPIHIFVWLRTIVK